MWYVCVCVCLLSVILWVPCESERRWESGSRICGCVCVFINTVLFYNNPTPIWWSAVRMCFCLCVQFRILSIHHFPKLTPHASEKLWSDRIYKIRFFICAHFILDTRISTACKVYHECESVWIFNITLWPDIQFRDWQFLILMWVVESSQTGVECPPKPFISTKVTLPNIKCLCLYIHTHVYYFM